MTERVAVIGGGISGLAAAYFALERGFAVDLFEGASRPGGLAASFDFDGLTIEKYYHFICGNDETLLRFADRLGIGGQVRFRPTKLNFYYNGRFHPFGTPWNLMRFSPISMKERIKFGLNVAVSKYTKHWDKLDGISAKAWLTQWIGERAYQVIWHPLLKVKFGRFYDQVSAAWIWHRIHRVARSRKGLFAKEKMGYFEGGTQTLVDAVTEAVKERGAGIRLKTRVRAIEKTGEGFRVATGDMEGKTHLEAGKIHDGEIYDKVVLAVPLPVAARLMEGLDPEHARKLAAIEYIGVVCGVFRLREGISSAFWLNINDPRIAANGLIEYTNLNPLDEIAPDRIVYIPFYTPLDSPWFAKDEKTLEADFFRILSTLRPGLGEEAVKGFRVFKSPNAQAICTVGFKDRVPEPATPVKNLFLIDSTQLYPSDRTLSALIGLAEQLVSRWDSDPP